MRSRIQFPFLQLLVMSLVVFAIPACFSGSTTFAPGKYQGRVEIGKLNACEKFREFSTDAFLTVSPRSDVMLLEYFVSNTKAADYFEAKEKTFSLEGGHMIGGSPDKSLYYFDVTFTYDSVKKVYVGKGTWLIRDECEAQYPVTITLAPVADFHY